MGNRWRVFFFCEFAKKNQDRELLATFSSKKVSSRDFSPNYAISFFRLHLILHAYVQRFDVMGKN
jgi:hypothetical protein